MKSGHITYSFTHLLYHSFIQQELKEHCLGEALCKALGVKEEEGIGQESPAHLTDHRASRYGSRYGMYESSGKMPQASVTEGVQVMIKDGFLLLLSI